MDKYVVCVFDNDKTAYDAGKAIMELDSEGSLTLFEGAIVSKDEKGEVRFLDSVEDGPVAALPGFLLGSLIGVIGGPVGMMAGGLVGSMGGFLIDIKNAGVNEEFLDEITQMLTPGKYALVAEISEGWTTPLDTRMEELGSTVLRSSRIDVEDQQIQKDVEASKQELKELKEEWKQAKADDKAKIKAKVDAVKAKLEKFEEKAKKKISTLEKESAKKLKKLDKQIKKAKGDSKAAFKKAHEDLKADYTKRIDNLKAAVEKAKSAKSA